MAFRLTLVISFLAVMVASAWVTMQVLDSPRASNSDTSNQGIAAIGRAITIVEATYGASCKAFNVAPPNENRVRAGNATQAVVANCAGKYGSCDYAVDVARLGDPASGCGKDFLVRWRCGTERVTNEARLLAEANGRSIAISCPPK